VDYQKKIPYFLVNSKVYDIVITDLEGKYLYVNENFKKRFSFVSNQFIGKSHTISIHPDDELKADQAVLKCLENPSQPVKVELRKPLKVNSSYYWTQWEFSLFTNDYNKPIGILCVGYDISKTKQNIAELVQTKLKLNKVIQAIPHPLMLLNNENKIVYVNNQFEHLFKYSLTEIVDKTIDFISSPNHSENFQDILESYKSGKSKTKRVEKFLFCKTSTNEKKPVGANLSSYVSDGKLFTIVILEDLTVSKQYQDAILNQNEALKKIAWKHSHEIRKPVTNLLGLANLFNEGADYWESNVKSFEYVKEAIKELDLMTRNIVKEANTNEYKIKFEKDKRYIS